VWDPRIESHLWQLYVYRKKWLISSLGHILHTFTAVPVATQPFIPVGQSNEHQLSGWVNLLNGDGGCGQWLTVYWRIHSPSWLTWCEDWHCLAQSSGELWQWQPVTQPNLVCVNMFSFCWLWQVLKVSSVLWSISHCIAGTTFLHTWLYADDRGTNGRRVYKDVASLWCTQYWIHCQVSRVYIVISYTVHTVVNTLYDVYIFIKTVMLMAKLLSFLRHCWLVWWQ